MNPPERASTSVRRQSMRSFGMSSMNLDAGFAPGWPHADRNIARDRYSRCLARVMPT